MCGHHRLKDVTRALLGEAADGAVILSGPEPAPGGRRGRRKLWDSSSISVS